MSWNWLNYISISAISSFIHAFLVFHSSDHQSEIWRCYYSALPKSRMNFPLLSILGCWWFAIQTEHLVSCLNIHDKLLMFWDVVWLWSVVAFGCFSVRWKRLSVSESSVTFRQKMDFSTLQEYSPSAGKTRNLKLLWYWKSVI